jgi:hypothetical protein
MRFSFDLRKSRRLRANPRRGIGFEEDEEGEIPHFVTL